MTTFKYRRRQNHHSIYAPEQRSQLANETIAAHLNSMANINSKDIMDRPQSAFSLTDARPAGVSRSAGGKKLGLNFSPVATTGYLPYLSLPSVSPSLARSLALSLPPSRSRWLTRSSECSHRSDGGERPGQCAQAKHTHCTTRQFDSKWRRLSTSPVGMLASQIGAYRFVTHFFFSRAALCGTRAAPTTLTYLFYYLLYLVK